MKKRKKVYVIFTSSIYPLAPPTGQTDTWQGRFVLTHFPQWGPTSKSVRFSSATIKHVTSNHSGKKNDEPFWEKSWRALFEKKPFCSRRFWLNPIDIKFGLDAYNWNLRIPYFLTVINLTNRYLVGNPLIMTRSAGGGALEKGQNLPKKWPRFAFRGPSRGP